MLAADGGFSAFDVIEGEVEMGESVGEGFGEGAAELGGGLEFAADADRYAYRQGLFVLGLTGEGLVQIQNSDQFQPTDFGGVGSGS